jgi:Asp-tRNA(Asn)/Glu-tRNA(Gln) amidotransferase A subunit family amidase
LLESRVSLARYEAACLEMSRARAALPELFQSCDVLLTPACAGEAPQGLSYTGDPIFNRSWTMLHVPCITVPAGPGTGGMPVGVQLVGQLADDARMLRAASALEAAFGIAP